ncbi:MAG: patatin family protein [Vallitaleaceae bacterium]|jgi:predicted patatin/cPLA2 family phospholipase|nr:patatin family protein [Vallitaleaceae bacterium]
MLHEASLILEGGGMRGVYTGGVLEYFMEQDLYFRKNYGVSAGACQGMSYLSRQAGRNKKVTIDLINDKRYMKLSGIIDGTGLFNKDFVFDEIPNHLVKFDFEAFTKGPEEMYAVVTDCKTGEADYINLKDITKHQDILTVLLASCSLPLIAPSVDYNGEVYMDGGLADSIPIRHAYQNGFNRHVLILTRERTYRKDITDKKQRVIRKVYKKYPRLIEAIERRDVNYNQSRDIIDVLEAEGLVYPIYPKEPLIVSRTDRDQKKLELAYQMGYEDGRYHHDRLIDFLEG